MYHMYTTRLTGCAVSYRRGAMVYRQLHAATVHAMCCDVHVSPKHTQVVNMACTYNLIEPLCEHYNSTFMHMFNTVITFINFIYQTATNHQTTCKGCNLCAAVSAALGLSTFMTDVVACSTPQGWLSEASQDTLAKPWHLCWRCIHPPEFTQPSALGPASMQHIPQPRYNQPQD